MSIILFIFEHILILLLCNLIDWSYVSVDALNASVWLTVLTGVYFRGMSILKKYARVYFLVRSYFGGNMVVCSLVLLSSHLLEVWS